MSKPRKHKSARRRAVDLTALAGRTAFSLEEVAAMEGISRATLNNYLRDGIGPRVVQTKPGGRVLITAQALSDWHQKLEREPLPQRGRPRADEQVKADVTAA